MCRIGFATFDKVVTWDARVDATCCLYKSYNLKPQSLVFFLLLHGGSLGESVAHEWNSQICRGLACWSLLDPPIHTLKAKLFLYCCLNFHKTHISFSLEIPQRYRAWLGSNLCWDSLGRVGCWVGGILRLEYL